MRILELLESFDTNYIERKSNLTFDKFKGDNDRDRLMDKDGGKKSGFTGRVYNNQNDPHTINKTNYIPDKVQNDGYIAYAKYLVDSGMAKENPFAPRFFEMKAYKDAQDNIKYRINMEKLHRCDEVNPAIINAIYANLYDEPVRDAVFNIAKYLPLPEMQLAKAIEMTVLGKISSNDENLNTLLAAINQLSKNGFELDMHGNNIMIRLGKVPQLVITDPLA